MAAELQRAPDKAERWRALETEAAITFAEILQGVEQPSMCDEEARASAELHVGLVEATPACGSFSAPSHIAGMVGLHGADDAAMPVDD